MGQRAAGEHQHFEDIVEHGRVAAGEVDDGQDLEQVLAEKVGSEHAFAGVHPVDVAAQGVDFAVVGQIAVRVRPRPVGEGVGAEA